MSLPKGPSPQSKPKQTFRTPKFRQRSKLDRLKVALNVNQKLIQDIKKFPTLSKTRKLAIYRYLSNPSNIKKTGLLTLKIIHYLTASRTNKAYQPRRTSQFLNLRVNQIANTIKRNKRAYPEIYPKYGKFIVRSGSKFTFDAMNVFTNDKLAIYCLAQLRKLGAPKPRKSPTSTKPRPKKETLQTKEKNLRKKNLKHLFDNLKDHKDKLGRYNKQMSVTIDWTIDKSDYRIIKRKILSLLNWYKRNNPQTHNWIFKNNGAILTLLINRQSHFFPLSDYFGKRTRAHRSLQLADSLRKLQTEIQIKKSFPKSTLPRKSIMILGSNSLESICFSIGLEKGAQKEHTKKEYTKKILSALKTISQNSPAGTTIYIIQKKTSSYSYKRWIKDIKPALQILKKSGITIKLIPNK